MIHPTNYACGYENLTMVEAVLESRWAAYASQDSHGTLLDDVFDVRYENGDPDLLEVAAGHARIVFTGPRYRGDTPVTAAYYTDGLPELEALFPALGPLLDMEHEHFLYEQVKELCERL